jgi:hypothetical protein
MEHDFKTPEDVTEFESQISKQAAKLPEKDRKKLEKAVKEKKNVTVHLPMKERYERAWKQVYNGLPNWRQKEIDNQMKSGILSDKDWDEDFVQQVTAIAESDELQAV